jgi:hypothetical protein
MIYVVFHEEKKLKKKVGWSNDKGELRKNFFIAIFQHISG